MRSRLGYYIYLLLLLFFGLRTFLFKNVCIFDHKFPVTEIQHIPEVLRYALFPLLFISEYHSNFLKFLLWHK